MLDRASNATSTPAAQVIAFFASGSSTALAFSTASAFASANLLDFALGISLSALARLWADFM
jgi:hypothetical protein